jgi:hypothetical protein
VLLDQFNQVQPSGEVLGVAAFVDEFALNGFDLHRDVQLQAAGPVVVLV